jgi:hypothetical protein
MNYEIQNELNKKVDDWKFHALETKVRELENQNVQLQRENGHYEGRINSQMRAIDTIIGLLIDKDLMPEYAETLMGLRQYL